MSYPSARRSSVVDDFVSGRYGGVKVPNPCHWLEDSATDESRSFIQEQNAQFQEYISDPTLASSRKLLESTLSMLHSLPTLLGAPQAAGNYCYYRVAGQGSMFPITYRAPKTTLIHGTQGTLDVLKQPKIFHDEAEDRGAVVSSGFSKGGNFGAYSSSITGSARCTIRVKALIQAASIRFLG
ncbi:hypothetical protein ACEPPN_013312 [Leptodophora sp. 'Broadleaf-Isolate-01']